MAWKGALKQIGYSAVRNSRVLWKCPRGRNLPACPWLQLRVHSSRPLPILPWSEILPFRSIRVNLTRAQKKGWVLDRIEDFPGLLEGKLEYVRPGLWPSLGITWSRSQPAFRPPSGKVRLVTPLFHFNSSTPECWYILLF